MRAHAACIAGEDFCFIDISKGYCMSYRRRKKVGLMGIPDILCQQ